MGDSLRIAAIGGDGIGPEVVGSTLPVLVAAAAHHGQRLDITELDWGADRYLRTGRAAPADSADIVRSFDGVLFGAVGRPDVPDHVLVWDLIIRLRQELQLAVNARPVVAFSGIEGPVRDVENVDFLVVRENTEGEYVGVGGRAHSGDAAEVAIEVAVHSRRAVQRTARYAFAQARSRRGNLIAVTKSNALRHGYTLWDEVVRETAGEFPEVAYEFVLVDAMAPRMVQQPTSLDVVLASNMFGDILSDLGAVLVGGLGMLPSANLALEGSTPGIFEPVHGSAPDIAGRNIANPIACVLSGAMLLEHVGSTEASELVRRAVAFTLQNPLNRTADLGGSATTSTVSASLLGAMEHVLGESA